MKIKDESIALENDGDIAGLADAKPDGDFIASGAMISVLAGTGSFVLTARTTPSDTVGHPVTEGDEIELSSQEEVEGFQIVQIGSVALKLYATYYFENSKL